MLPFRRRWPVVLSFFLLAGGVCAEESIPWPQGFREWSHVKSAVILPGHPLAKTEAGIHHIYANQKAFAGYRSGKFADGSVIVYELVEAPEKDAVISEGQRRRVDLMVRDAKRYSSTGGWGFARFWPDRKADESVRKSADAMCFQCHSRQKESAFVFSTVR